MSVKSRSKGNSMETYSFENNVLKVIDPEMNINCEEVFEPIHIPPDPRNNLELGEGHMLKVFAFFNDEMEYYVIKDDKFHGEYRLTYPEGTIKMKCFYKEGLLHGPSTFFSESGQVTTQTWFLQGKQEGKAFGFYKSGAKAYVQRFCDGRWEGLQEYWYENGNVKTSMTYLDGELDGDVLLYFPNGQLKRKLTFSSGKCLEEVK